MKIESGNPGTECHHLIRTNQGVCYSAPPPLMAASLQSMVDQGLLSTTRQEECQQLQRKAVSEEVNCVFPIFWENPTPPEMFLHFSVFTGEKDSWCHFGRTRVSFDPQGPMALSVPKQIKTLLTPLCL